MSAYVVALSREEMAVLLNAMDARIKLAQKFMAVPETAGYWEAEQNKAIAMRQRLRDMAVPPGEVVA